MVCGKYVYESECGAKLSPVLLLSVSDMSVALFSPPPKFDFYVACPLEVDVVFPHDLLRNDFPRAMKKVKEGRETSLPPFDAVCSRKEGEGLKKEPIFSQKGPSRTRTRARGNVEC